MILLLPYGIAIAIGPHFPPDYSGWTRTERLVGLFPGFWRTACRARVGTAGAVLVGLLRAVRPWDPDDWLASVDVVEIAGLGARGSGLGNNGARRAHRASRGP